MLPTFAAERSRYQSPLVLSLDGTDGRTLDRYTDHAAHTRLAASVSQLHFDSTISLIYFLYIYYDVVHKVQCACIHLTPVLLIGFCGSQF